MDCSAYNPVIVSVSIKAYSRLTKKLTMQGENMGLVSVVCQTFISQESCGVNVLVHA